MRRIPPRMERSNPGPSIGRYLVVHSALGAGIGVAIVVALLAFDIAGIRTLVAASTDVFPTMMILLIGSLTTVMPMVIATAIGLLAHDARIDTVCQRPHADDAGRVPSSVPVKIPPDRR